MRRLNKLTYEEIIAYNLRDNGNEFTVFLDTQGPRVLKARELVDGCLRIVNPEDNPLATIVELGCSAGDIVGHFADRYNCYGYDVTPGAVRAARERYPALTVIETAVESVAPQACEVLVLCEFLEHIVDPVGLVQAWMPLAKSVVIGHPVNNFNDPEYGHLWEYEPKDFDAWFLMGGHVMDEAYSFEMGYQFVIGRGHRL